MTTPSLPSPDQVITSAAGIVGTPTRIDVLKAKPGRRCTWRITGPRGSAIAKAYTSDRAVAVATKVASLDLSQTDPIGQNVITPQVLAVEPDLRLLIVSDLPGTPWSDRFNHPEDSIHFGIGSALARWHHQWRNETPLGLKPHTSELEWAALQRQADRVAEPTRSQLLNKAAQLIDPWAHTTVVHRDLYEEQILYSPGTGVSLIDLDDSALGPAELDVGNILAHLDLAHIRNPAGRVDRIIDEFLDGYITEAPLDAELLARCRALTTLRLCCLHKDLRDVLVVKRRPLVLW